MKGRVILFLGLASLAMWSSGAQASVTLLDGFESGEGHFTGDANSSGSSAGMVKTLTTMELDTTEAFEGLASQRIFVDDDPSVAGGGAPNTAWRLRHLSGGGAVANNVALNSTGFVGYYLKTSTSGMQASLIIDDGTTGIHERGKFQPITADGQWHLYEWDLDAATANTEWAGFAGTGNNGLIDSATVSLDSFWITMATGTGDFDATFWVDNVSHDPEGHLPAVPEPATLGLVALGGLLLRRRRA